jgi:hypothetical protein
MKVSLNRLSKKIVGIVQVMCRPRATSVD